MDARSLRERLGWQKTVVAVANKNARMLWAVLAPRVAAFDRRPPLGQAQPIAGNGLKADSAFVETSGKFGSLRVRRALEDAPHRSDRQQVNSDRFQPRHDGDDDTRMESC